MSLNCFIDITVTYSWRTIAYCSVVIDGELAVGCSPLRIRTLVSAMGRLLAASAERLGPHCTFTLVVSGAVVVLCCTFRFPASTSAEVRTFRLLSNSMLVHPLHSTFRAALGSHFFFFPLTVRLVV